MLSHSLLCFCLLLSAPSSDSDSDCETRYGPDSDAWSPMPDLTLPQSRVESPHRVAFRESVLQRDRIRQAENAFDAVQPCLFCHIVYPSELRQVGAAHVIPSLAKKRRLLCADRHESNESVREYFSHPKNHSVQNGVTLCGLCAGLFEDGLVWVDAQQLIVVHCSIRRESFVRARHGQPLRMPADAAQRANMPTAAQWAWRKRWAKAKRRYDRKGRESPDSDADE